MTANPWLKSGPMMYSLLCTLLITLLPAAAIAQSQPPLFPLANTLPIGAVSTPAIADFNGDGQPDLIYSPPPVPTGSQQFVPLTVLLNQGVSANPTPVVTTSLSCTSVTSLVVADINHDQKPDVALTCSNGFVAILFGNGDGTFLTPAYYAVTGAQALINPVDLNGDGYPDVVVTTQAGPVVLLNKGSSAPGILGSPTTFPGVPQTTFTLVGAGDFNGDGKEDILAGGTQFALYLGNGDGTFQPPQTQSVPAGATSPVIADLNHDGISDVAYITTAPSAGAPQTVQVLLGNSSGKFTIGSSLSLDPSTNYISLAPAGSTNNGANIDLALGGTATSILLGDGNGGFTVGQTYAIAGTPFIAGGSSLAEASSSGNTNLVFFTFAGVTRIAGNGDGTFHALPNLPVGPTGFVDADFNGDGLTDIVSVSAAGTLVTALGRGNGTFTVTDQIPAAANEFLLTGDFNADGHPDVIAITLGGTLQDIPVDSQLFFYKGNGDGSFQPASTGIDLLTTGAIHALTGDFNNDGHLDVIVSAYATVPNQGQSGQALIFVPGNGDGTFGTPVLFSSLTSFATPSSLFSADLNNDKKPDLIWNSSIYLSKGDGSFLQQPLGLIGTPLTIGDLNGDGIADIVIQAGGTENVFPGVSVYAGNGDGTFQATPFFTTAAPSEGTSATFALPGDLNADGHTDLLLQSQTPDATTVLTAYLGDGKGNFNLDPNTYVVGNVVQNGSAAFSPIATFARLNNRAPALPNDNALDYLTLSNSGATSLLNQTNPTPAAPSLIASTIKLAVPSGTIMPNQQLTLTATITGANPTGQVTFVIGTTPIGSATITNGTATLTTSFAAINTYSVIANYAGNSVNLPSTSNAISIVVSVPDFILSNRLASAIIISAGQTITTTLTVQPLGGYSGTVKFSCSALPVATSCSLSPTTATVANGLNQTTTLTILTTAQSISASSIHQQNLSNRVPLLAWASLFLLVSLPRRTRRFAWRAVPSLFLLLLLIGGLLSLSGCSSTPAANKPPPTPSTPRGLQSVTVTASDAAGGPSHSLNIQFTVQ